MTRGPEDDPNWVAYRHGKPITARPVSAMLGKTVETPDSALTSEQIEEKITLTARDLLFLWPEHLKFSTLGESWEDGTAKGPSEYDLKHLHLNRLLDLREMIQTGAIHPVEG